MHRRKIAIAASVAAVVIAALAVLLLSRRVAVIHDYGFESAGFMQDDTGKPVADARVTIVLHDGTGYRAVQPIRSETVETNERGQFGFACLVHEKGINYSLQAERDGFLPTTVEAQWPRDFGAVRIVLRRAM